jgi:hypothetical protein
MALDERQVRRRRWWTLPRREAAARITLAVIIVVLFVAVLLAMRLAGSSELIAISRVEARSVSPSVAVTALHNDCSHDPRVRVVSETAERVRIRVDRRRGLADDCDDIGLTSRLVAELETALGSRTIVVETARAGFECIIDGVESDRCTAG